MATGSRAPHLLPLAGTSWWMWRECALRGAGFPARRVLPFCDPELAQLARSGSPVNDSDAFSQAWPAAIARSHAAARELAADPGFREAIAWQNPAMVPNCLDVTRLRRKHELAIASYAQRYLLKNDTVGFFGPLAWASWQDGPEPIRTSVGPGLVAERRVYFETWAIDAVAQRLARDSELQAWLRPRVAAACLIVEGGLRRPQGTVVPLSGDEQAVLSRCDGTRTVRELAATLATPVELLLRRLRAWRDEGVLSLDLTGPVEARPEVTLRHQLMQIGDDGGRLRALAVLAELEAARDAVAAAAGDADAVLTGMATLERVFERITGCRGSRRPGQTNAGRRLVYQDCRRDVLVTLGRPLARLVAPALALVLDSARWLVARVAAEYERVLRDLYHQCAARLGTDPVPLATLLAAATPDLMAARPAPLAGVLAEFQQRWARVLRVPPGARRHQLAVEQAAGRIRTEFPAAPPPWAAARCHSADLLLATDGRQRPVESLTPVLGELHLARNTLENRPLVEFHDQPSRLLAAVEADFGDQRAYHVPPKAWPQVSPRTYPSPLLSRHYTYWCMYDDPTGAPGRILPAAALTVYLDGDRLVVRSSSDGTEYPLLELIGEQLSNVVVNAFEIIPATGHRPRVTLGRLVVRRESWTFDPGACEWARHRDRSQRFRQAQLWRAAHQLPERAFYTVAGEKPRFVDFRSVAFVEILARAINQADTRRVPSPVQVVEMLPDVDQTWLADADGNRYTSELRCVLVSGRPETEPTAE